MLTRLRGRPATLTGDRVCRSVIFLFYLDFLLPQMHTLFSPELITVHVFHISEFINLNYKTNEIEGVELATDF